MRRACLLSLALLAVAVPSPAQAASFSTTVERNTCVSGAGKFHLGQGVLRVRVIEYGKSGANRFTYLAQVWHLPIHGTKWTKEYQWATTETTFQDDASSHYESRQFAYAPDHNAYHKIALRVRVWHDGTLLYSKRIMGKMC